jgi:tetratricopeptide (TPR) repeat protein
MPISGKHVDLGVLARFASSKLAPGKMLEVGRHLFVCDSCRLRLRTKVRGGAEVLDHLRQKGWPEDADYEAVFERLEGSLAERMADAEQDRRTAPTLYAELSRHSPPDRRAVVRSHRFQSPGLVELLLDDCRSTWAEDPAGAESQAELALELAECLRASQGPGLANDLMARAWAYAGNVHRIRFFLREAEAAFAAAEACLNDGTGDPLEKALVLDLKVSLLRATRRLDSALTTIDEVIRIYHRTKETHLEGRGLVSKGLLYTYKSEPEKAMPLFERALPMIDIEREPKVFLLLKNNIVLALVDLGRYGEASAKLPQLRQLSVEIGSWPDHSRCLWLEAKIDVGLGRLNDAEGKLRMLRDDYTRREIGYDVALVSLELVSILMTQGRLAEVKQVASEMHTLFASRELHGEALAALMLFQRAAEQETANLRMIEDILKYLKRAHGNPEVRFESPALATTF